MRYEKWLVLVVSLALAGCGIPIVPLAAGTTLGVVVGESLTDWLSKSLNLLPQSQEQNSLQGE